MTPEEFERWQSDLAVAYAEEQVAAGNWPQEKALELARDNNAKFLPQGLATPGMLLLVGVRGEQAPIGRIWIGLKHPRGVADCAFLYDIEVFPRHRGKGLGRGLLAAGEAAVREHGVHALELNVFGSNTAAIGLYRSCGYRTTTQQLRKDLSTSPDPVEADPLRQATSAWQRAVFAGETDGLGAAERGVAALAARTALARAKLVNARSQGGSGDADQQLALLRHAADTFHEIGDGYGEAEALCWSGIVHQVLLRDDAEATPLFQRALRDGDTMTRSFAARHLAIAEQQAGRLDSARALLEESTRLRRDIGFIAGVAANLVGLISIAAADGRHADARAMILEARRLAAECGASTIVAQIEQAEKALAPRPTDP
jgi:ribosomal protein S18 acetylase RimI-like enzyme